MEDDQAAAISAWTAENDWALTIGRWMADCRLPSAWWVVAPSMRWTPGQRARGRLVRVVATPTCAHGFTLGADPTLPLPHRTRSPKRTTTARTPPPRTPHQRGAFPEDQPRPPSLRRATQPRTVTLVDEFVLLRTA
jgi:hypothetical protein